MQSSAQSFKVQAELALEDVELQRALGLLKNGFQAARTRAVEAIPEFEALRTTGREIKEHTLAHLDYYLEAFEAQVIASGGQVHWASTPAEPRFRLTRFHASHRTSRL